MVRWALNLYTTEKTKKMLPRIMRAVGKKKLQPGVWFITIASNEKNLLDLFHGIYYVQPMFMRMNPDIVGVAESEDKARELLLKITEDIYQETGAFDVRSYFKFEE